MRYSCAALAAAMLAVLASGSAIAATLTKGTVLNTVLASNESTANVQKGDRIVLHVVAPYPDSSLAGATITAHVTSVQHASPGTSAGVGFLFDVIKLQSGSVQPIAAYVVSSQVTQRNHKIPGLPPPANTAWANQPRNAINPGAAPQQSTIFWQHNVGSGSGSTGSGGSSPMVITGGYFHARQTGVDVSLPAGSAVKLELAHSLTL